MNKYESRQLQWVPIQTQQNRFDLPNSRSLKQNLASEKDLELNYKTQTQRLEREWRSPMSKSPIKNKPLTQVVRVLNDQNITYRSKIQKVTKIDKQIDKENHQIVDIPRIIESQIEIKLSTEKEIKLKYFLCDDSYEQKNNNLQALNHSNRQLLKTIFSIFKMNRMSLQKKSKKGQIIFLKKFISKWIHDYKHDICRLRRQEFIEQMNLQIKRKTLYTWFTFLQSPQNRQINKVIVQDFRKIFESNN